MLPAQTADLDTTRTSPGRALRTSTTTKTAEISQKRLSGGTSLHAHRVVFEDTAVVHLLARPGRPLSTAEAGNVEAALKLVDRLELDQYHYLHATRAELLRRLDRIDDARAAYERALELVHSEAEQRFFEQRLRTPRLTET